MADEAVPYSTLVEGFTTPAIEDGDTVVSIFSLVKFRDSDGDIQWASRSGGEGVVVGGAARRAERSGCVDPARPRRRLAVVVLSRRGPSGTRSWRRTLPISLRGSASTIVSAGGDLVGRERRPAPRLELVERRAADDERPRDFAEPVVGDAGDRDVCDTVECRGCRSSTSSGNTFRPPRLIMALTRPSIHTKPSASMRARSPVRSQPSAVTRSSIATIVGRQPGVGTDLELADLVGPADVAGRRSSYAELERRVRAADRAELRGAELLPVGRAPAHRFAAELGLAVAVEDRDAEPFVERARVRGRQRRGDAADVAQRLERGDRVVVGEHHERGRREHRRPDAVLVHQPRELARFELRHEHDGCAEAGTRTAPGRCPPRARATSARGSASARVLGTSGPGARRAASAMTLSRISPTVSWRSTTAFGAPVVPDVNWTIACSGVTARGSAGSRPITWYGVPGTAIASPDEAAPESSVVTTARDAGRRDRSRELGRRHARVQRDERAAGIPHAEPRRDRRRDVREQHADRRGR